MPFPEVHDIGSILSLLLSEEEPSKSLVLSLGASVHSVGAGPRSGQCFTHCSCQTFRSLISSTAEPT